MPIADGFLGKDFLLKLSDEGTSPVYTILGGLQATDMKFKINGIDVTNKDSGSWRTLIAGGIRSLDISASGVWRNETTQRTAMTIFLAAGLRHWQIVDGNGDIVLANFMLADLSRAGNHDKDESFTIALQSSGPITYTPGPA